MVKLKRFEDLRVWQEAKELTLIVYSMFQGSKDFGFKDQIQRASVSVMNNIAEGFERGSDAEFIRFLFIAKSSAGEVRSMVYLAQDLKYLNIETSEDLLIRLQRLSGSIANLIKYLKNKKQPLDNLTI